MKVLMFTKHTDICDIAVSVARDLFGSNLTVKYEVDEECYEWKGEYILSFINGLYIPPEILSNARLALNWHTAPPSWPGTGGYSMALYFGDEYFGITVHIMDEHFDHGPIIAIKYFRIPRKITIDKLLNLAHWHAFRHFKDFIRGIGVWKCKAYTRKDMLEVNKQMQITRPEVF